MSHTLFPVFINLLNRRVLIVGAGQVASGKIRQLVPAGADITVIAPDCHPAVQEFIRKYPRQLLFLQRDATPEDIAGYDLIILATDQPDLHCLLAAEARRLKIWVNSVDEPVNSDFYACSVMAHGPVRVAISTDGKAPGLSAVIRKALQALLPEHDIPLWERFLQLRSRIKESLPDPAIRTAILKETLADLEARYFGMIGEEEHLRTGGAAYD